MNRRLIPLLLLVPALGCSDIIEEDLSGLRVALLTPPDRDTVSTNVVQFRWEELPQAEDYRIQVAIPDFVAPQEYIVDSVVSGTVAAFALAPGDHEWRVRGQNTSSHTEYSLRRLVVRAASSLQDLTPILISPAQNAYLVAADIGFSWQPLPGAEDYRVEVRQDDAGGPVLQAQVVSGTTATAPAWPEGRFAWGVQGQNGSSVSAFSYRTFTVDRTAPTAPLLINPAANATIANTTFTFQWQSGTDVNGTVDTVVVSDQNQLEVRRVGVTGTTHADSLGSGTYTWTVRSSDPAGNTTSAVPRSLTIQ